MSCMVVFCYLVGEGSTLNFFATMTGVVAKVESLSIFPVRFSERV
jgi:hypothetical protein